MVSVRSHRPAPLERGQTRRRSEPQTSKGREPEEDHRWDYCNPEPTYHHSMPYSREKNHSKEHPKQKSCTKLVLRKCAPTSLPKISPSTNVHPRKNKTRCIQTHEHMPDSHTPA
ncbi:hypothetical protein ILYODFUR_038648 [Ilyodon furcidens]|uniref:Uncharacterized protein n=1 Tax=Ilyodon furcidens TaxID=33524 RepID=A0ABV0V9M4_9TELE